MRKNILLWLVSLAAAGTLWHQSQPLLFPCSSPVEYSIGDVDARFKMSSEEFAAIVDEAAAKWEQTSGRDLFTRVAEGGVVIHAIYDEKQE